MRNTAFSQKTLTVNESSRMHVRSPSPVCTGTRSFSSEVRASSSNNRGQERFQETVDEATTKIHVHRQNEKEELQEVNTRFAGYINKVRSLEQKNKALLSEIEDLTRRLKERGAGISEEYEKEFKELKDLIEKLTKEKGAADIERGNLEEEIEIWNAKCEEELALKEEAEKTLREFRQDVDDATLQKLDLERRVEQLVDEIEFLKKLHDDEVADLLRQIEESKVNVELESTRPDLVAALRAFRVQIEQAATKNIQEAEKWYKTKLGSLKGQVSKNEDKIRTIKEEISRYSSQVSDLQTEIELLRAQNEALEKQLDDMEAQHLEKVSALQEILAQLECQLLETKADLARYLQDYQDLLNVKLKLDAEIAVYRKLLEGEEERLGISVESEVRGDNLETQKISTSQKVETSTVLQKRLS